MTIEVGDLIFYTSSTTGIKYYCIVNSIEKHSYNDFFYGLWRESIQEAKEAKAVTKNDYGFMTKKDVYLVEKGKITNWREEFSK